MQGKNYYGEKDEMNSPKLMPNEVTYLIQTGVSFIEKRGEFPNGALLLTSHHLFWYSPANPSIPVLKVPLFYISERKTEVRVNCFLLLFRVGGFLQRKS